MRARFTAVGLAFAIVHVSTSTATVVAPQVGEPLARFEWLKPGAYRYLRYTQMGPKRSAIDIWTRTISLEPKDGKRLLHIVMRWDEVSGPTEFLEQDAWFEPTSFRPITHIRTRRLRDSDKTEVSGYRFFPDRIVGMPEIADNLRKDFSIESPEAAFNFEYDMEFLRALPLASGYSVSIPFYDPGDFKTRTARYTFTVAGSDRIIAPDGHAIDCWLVTADYNTGKVVSRFWFAKKTQVLVREEQSQPDGSLLIKTLLESEAGDARTDSSATG